MPPRSSLTGSFSATDQNNEVVCPLRNHDGSNCRKRCLGEKRYRSMQEHIRRAHPEHYIPKLPATEESFQLMINTAPSERSPPLSTSTQPAAQSFGSTVYGHERDSYGTDAGTITAPRSLEDQYPAAATAAVALAQLHNHRPGGESDWDSEAEYASETELRRRGMHPSVELPPLQQNASHPPIPPYQSSTSRPRELLPSMMANSPPERSSTLPPLQRNPSFQRRDKPNRPRKSSITQNSRKPKHEKARSKDHGRRLSIEGRKAFSAEPPGLSTAAAAAAKGKRWEDLIEAATSATEADSDRDLTPIPQSPSSVKRSSGSMPPFPPSISHNQSYKASPLGRTLTPPPPHLLAGPSPFPSVETSGMSLDSNTSAHSTHTSASGQNFHIPSSGLSSSDTATSPTYYNSQHTANNSQSSNNSNGQVQIYCANCRRLSVLRDSYACTECISGFCSDCVYMLSSDFSTTSMQQRMQMGGVSRGRPCPRCGIVGGRFKPFQLDIR